MRVVVLVLVATVFERGYSQLRVPPNPCPNVFRYALNQQTEQYYGEISVPYDGSINQELLVNASLSGLYRNAMRLQVQLITPPQHLHGRPNLNYYVSFPFSHILPTITRIVFNGKIYCAGPPEQMTSLGVTDIWAEHSHYSGTPLSTNNEVREEENQLAPVGNTNVATSDLLLPEVDMSDLDMKDVPNLGTSFQQSNPFFASTSSTERLPTVNQQTTTRRSIVSRLPSIRPEPSTEALPDPEAAIVDPHQLQRRCGLSKNSVVSLIVGGEDVNDGAFPWLTAMFVAKGNSYEYRCTGNLISDRHVVTAARCMRYYNIKTVAEEDMLFVLGTSDVKRWATNGAITRGVRKVHIHPEYNQKTAHGDIAVVTLDRPVQLTPTLSPICLWEGDSSFDDVIDRRGTVAGWGMTEAVLPDNTEVHKARYVDMPIVSYDNCLYANETFATLSSDMTFCAGERNGKGPCVGDSGAGFMIKLQNRYYLRGIVSFALAPGSCDLNNYVLFTDTAVPKAKSFIEKAMKY